VIFWTHTRLDSILFGSVLALWNNPVSDTKTVTLNRTTGYFLALLLLIPTFAIRDEAFLQTFRYTFQGLGLMALFHTAIRDRGFAWKLLDNAPMRWIAALSYTLYLVHSGMSELFTPLGNRRAIPAVVAAFGCSFVFALLMRRYVELPIAASRRRVERTMRPTDPAETGSGPASTC
jgi:peptidoglycan/LPS O-acetylase OafA/YrhL